MKRIMVTGAAGYLGGHIVEMLLSKGHSVVAVDNLHKKYNSIIDILPVELHYKFDGQIIFIDQDVRKLDNFYECDLIIHLAAIVGEPDYKNDPSNSYSTNIDGTLNLCKSKIPMIFASTCSVYGQNANVCTEATKPNPIGGYAMSKVIAENIVELYGGAIFRMGTLHGLGRTLESTRFDILLNEMAFNAAQGNEFKIYSPESQRPFIHVIDAAQCFVDHALREELDLGIWNLNAGNYSKLDLVLEIRKQITDFKTDVKTGGNDPRHYLADSGKYINQYGNRDTIDISVSIDQIIKAMRE